MKASLSELMKNMWRWMNIDAGVQVFRDERTAASRAAYLVFNLRVFQVRNHANVQVRVAVRGLTEVGKSYQ